ncbi:MAG: hypothetical protein R8K21_01845 [Mariprofundales bacterium]
MILSIDEIKQLEKKLAQTPNNTDLMNKVAIAYMENPLDFISDGGTEDLKLFEKAYKTQQTVKTINNLAYQLFIEFAFEANQKRAMQLQKSCIEMKPNSYMPYYLYGHMLLESKNYKDAIKYFEIAYDKRAPKRSIYNHFGTAYFQLGLYEKAISCFQKSLNPENIYHDVWLNLAMANAAAGNKEKAREILQDTEKNIEWNEPVEGCNSFIIAEIYTFLGDYNSVVNLMSEKYIGYVSMKDMAVGYAFYISAPDLFKAKLAEEIQDSRDEINDMENNPKDHIDGTDDIIEDLILDCEKDIITLQDLPLFFAQGKPKIKLKIIYGGHYTQEYGNPCSV